MSLIVTPMHELRNHEVIHFVRISNARGDTIDINVETDRNTYELAHALNEFAQNLTIIEDTKGD